MAFNSHTIARTPAGIPSGGQFATTLHAEPTVSLGASFSRDMIQQITNRHEEQGAAFIELTEFQLNAVRDHIDRTRDFSHSAVRKAAEEAYFDEHSYTPAEHKGFITSYGDTSAYYADPNARRRDIEQMRKDMIGPLPGYSG